MKNIIYPLAFASIALVFGCNGAASSSTASTDSTAAADSNAAATQPAAPAQSSAAPSSAAAPVAQEPAPTTTDVQEEAAAPPEPTTQVTYQQFYDELAPDGKWVNYPGQGNVFAPNVSAGFQPYSTNGHWVYSNAGWTWVSDYKWGWATFHYGSWFQDSKYGWLWKPGTQWAPAQVKWGQSGGYYGWAPLAPNITHGQNWTPPANTWTFVPKEHLDKPDVDKYVVNRASNVTIVKNVTVINNIVNNNRTVINNNSNKTVINNNKTVVNNNNKTINNNNTVVNNRVALNNTVYNKGPQKTEVEKVTNKKITQINIANNAKPAPTTVNNNKLVIYRPAVKEESTLQKKSAPAKVEQYEPKKKN